MSTSNPAGGSDHAPPPAGPPNLPFDHVVAQYPDLAPLHDWTWRWTTVAGTTQLAGHRVFPFGARGLFIVDEAITTAVFLDDRGYDAGRYEGPLADNVHLLLLRSTHDDALAECTAGTLKPAVRSNTCATQPRTAGSAGNPMLDTRADHAPTGILAHTRTGAHPATLLRPVGVAVPDSRSDPQHRTA